MLSVRAAAALRGSRQTTVSLLRRNYASSHGEHADEHHHQDEHHEAIAFPKEDFSSPVWRSFALFGLAVVGFYKFAPAPGEDNPLSSFIAHYSTPGTVWEQINFKHLLQTIEGSNETLLVADARPPLMHRYRYPQRLEQLSPHLQPVGMQVDMSNVVVKTD